MSYSFVVNFCCSTLKQKMGDYGEYLLCPVCKELITHPVLLPCQHSVCYGCARSQILAADCEENGTILEAPSTPRRNRANSSTLQQVKHRRRLESTPSECSVLSYASSKRDSGIETSPTHGSGLTKGFSFVSTASSTCSSGSNEAHPNQNEAAGEMKNGRDDEKDALPTKTKSKNVNSRRILPKFHSSPRLLSSSNRSNGSPGAATKADVNGTPTSGTVRTIISAESPTVCAPVASDVDSGLLNGDACSPVVYRTEDLVHFEASGLEAGNRTPGRNDEEGDPHEHSNCSQFETPKTNGMKPRKKSAAKPPRKNSKLNVTMSSTDLGKASPTSTSSPSSISNSSSKASKGMRRANSTSTISRSPSMRSIQRGADVMKRSKVKSIYCLTCESDVELGKLGIKGLFRNFQLEGIVERFRAKAKAKVAIRCGYCKPPASDATKSCLDCKLSYCNQCYKTVHVWGTKKAQHDFVGPTNNFSRPKVMLCPEHGTEPVNMFCSRCQHSVCRACKSRGGAHANHPIIPVKNAYKESKDRLYGLMDVLRNKKDYMEGAITELENEIKSFEDEEVAVRDEIHSAIDEMHKQLELKRTELLEKADCYARRKENEMRKDLQNMKSNAMFSSVMAFAEEVLLETDPAYFLQTIKMVETRVQEAIEHMTRIPDAAGDNDKQFPFGVNEAERRSMLRLYLDLDQQRNSIDRMDFLKAPGVPIFHDLNSNEAVCGAKVSGPRAGEWRLENDTVAADCFQIQYWKEQACNDGLFETHDLKGSTFHIPITSDLVKCSGEMYVRVRAANRVGFGPWSEVTKISANFLRRDIFKLTNIVWSDRLRLSESGRIAYHQQGEDLMQKTEFSFLTGDVSLDGFSHYFEVSASGGADFHFVVGVTCLGRDYLTAEGLVDDMDASKSALLYCGPRDCYLVENPATELHSLLRGRSGSVPSRLTNGDHMQASTKAASSFSALKPLKQLKNTLLRRSSINGPIGSLKAKGGKSSSKREDRQFRALTNEDSPSTCGLLRSSSVTSLPSVLRAQSPVSDQMSRSSSQWNIRTRVGLRCFRIGVEIMERDDGKVCVQFHDVSNVSPFIISSTVIDTQSPFNPVLAMAGEGQIAVM